MVEQRRFSLVQIRDAIQQASVEMNGKPVVKEWPNEPDSLPRSVAELAGNEFLYQQIWNARKKAATLGGEFWIEPSKNSPTGSVPRLTKKYDEEQVAGILDELNEMMKMKKGANDKRIAKAEYPSFDEDVLYKAEEILFLRKDQK